MPHNKKKLATVCEESGLNERALLEFIERHWIEPAAGGDQGWELDDEDVARALLIVDLRQSFGVNDEAVPLILHLVDQLHALHIRLRRAA